ncbi:hypothetical protein [Rhizobium etli]|uniref:hypothetical protein n=1 Tax=Rhizobium etli TaxID=29449 RepID=UPI0003839C65|nr:hypothetical protein [Rhizobium etli]AGS20443.1 hypothetical protein REMIM1_CH00587 [Rhizobium etli bv. mimosae str. Mim1]
MWLGRNLIQTAIFYGALAMPPIAHADISAEEAFLVHISIETVPRMQREYLRVNLQRLGKTETIDIAFYVASGSVDRWYVEGIFDGVNGLPHEPIPGEEVVVTGELIERWRLSPFRPYYL